MITYCPDQSSIDIVKNTYPQITYASSIFELLSEDNIDEAVFATYASISDNPLVVCLVLDTLNRRKVKTTFLHGQRPLEMDKYDEMLKIHAQFHVDLVRVKTKRKLNILKIEKKRTGGVPWGFSVCTLTNTLIPDEYEQSVTNKIRELKHEQHKNFRQIARFLNENNYKKRNGNMWNDTNVKTIYKNYDKYKYIRNIEDTVTSTCIL